MVNQIEAMKQALEALEHMLEDAKQERLTVEYWNECVDAITTLRTAIEQAEKQEPVGKVNELFDEAVIEQCGFNRELLVYITPPAAPVQEPVSNGKLNVTLQDTPTEIELARYKRMFEAACSALGEVSEALGCDPNEGGSEPLIEAIARLKSSSYEPIAWMVYTLDGKSVFVTDNPTDFTDEHRALPLYTTPPAAQREWRGLTDKEADKIYKDASTFGEMMRMVEAKLRENNMP